MQSQPALLGLPTHPFQPTLSQPTATPKQQEHYNDIKPISQNNTNNKKYNLVINLSNIQLNEHILKLLSKGLNFSITPQKIPIEEILCNIEYDIKNLPNNIKEQIKQGYSITLRKAKPPKRNVSKHEYLALKTLNSNPDMVVLKADKGGAIVITNKSDYIEKMPDHLNNSGCYRKLNKNPLNNISKKVCNLIKTSKIQDNKNLIVNNPYTPRIYGAPKIHKEEIPLRPIVNMINGPTYHLAKHLAKKLKPLVGNT